MAPKRLGYGRDHRRFPAVSTLKTIFRLAPFSTLLAFCSLGATLIRSAEPLDYNRDVRPILSENCFSCHGPDEHGRKGKRRLDLAESAYAEREGIFAIKPGQLAESDLWHRIASEFEDELMPPKESHLSLTAAQKGIFKRWIEEGAPYAPHWSFVAPKKATLPVVEEDKPLPAIDAFVLARLAVEKLSPAAPADRAVLIRRVSFDLTGLPPSAVETSAFAGDADPRAYERIVDRLLASPHFGERMALEWLDAARYADTNGFSIDGGRHLWLWRDWVIQSFNDNLPYDRFIAEQLAGDLMPNRTPAQLIATGFQRNNMVTHEGGTILEENLTNYNVDRVKTYGESILGLTLACGQCHDHKFDPISQEEYFRIFAYFNTLGDRGIDGNGGVNPAPSIRAKTVLRTDEEPQLRDAIAALKAELARPDAKVQSAWEKREQRQLAARGKRLAVHPVRILTASTPGKGSGCDIEGDNRVRLTQPPGMVAYDLSTELPRISEPITGVRITMHPVSDLPGGGWGNGPFVAAPLARRADDGEGPAEMPPANAGVEPNKGSFMLTALAASADAVVGDQIDLHKLQRLARVTANSWDPAHPPTDCIDPRNDAGWSPDLATEGPVHLTATFTQPVLAKDTPFLALQVNFGHGKLLVPGLIEISAIAGTDDGTDLPAEIVATLVTRPSRRTAEQRSRLWTYCASRADELAPRRIALANLEERLSTLTEPYTTMVMDVSAKPRSTFILNRGDYSQPTRKVTPGTLAILPALPADAPANRLGLAEWTTMKSNPLVARVAVNRLWKICFGTGLVATVADFGAQGEWPSHPELLDWLAVDFVESGWDVKALLRQIVLSQTYRQSSVASSESLERDPQNRLLARGPRFRLPAEFVRDSALKIGGLLVPRIGGPSVNPYAPGDLWREVSHYGSTPATSQTFVQDHGEKLYRRSMYTYWKRTAPPPNMMAFDAPNREVCTVARAETITPLQALVTLNDPQFVEASRAFAERMLAQSGSESRKLRWGFAEATSREPEPAELSVLTRALARERARYAKDSRAALQYLAIGESPRRTTIPPAEHAAWAQVAATLLNLSETLTRN